MESFLEQPNEIIVAILIGLVVVIFTIYALGDPTEKGDE